MIKRKSIFGWKSVLYNYGWKGILLDSILPLIISATLCFMIYLNGANVYDQLKHLLSLGISIVPAMIALILTAYTIMLSFIIGDVSLCVTFDKSDIPDDYSFFGLESHFKSATNNNGNSEEDRNILSVEDYKTSIDKYVRFQAKIKYKEYVKLIDKMWNLSGRPNYMPIKMKIKYIEMLLDERVKIGERKTKNRMVDIFNFLTDNILIWY